MILRPLLALLLALAALPAWAQPEVAGRWLLDKERSLLSLTAANTMKPAEAAEVVSMFADAEVNFEGPKMRVALGPQKVTCDWQWGQGGEIAFKACVDEKNRPAPGGPDRLVLTDDGLLRFYEQDGSALTFRRGG